MEVPVTIREAMAGATINLPTVAGQIKVKIPPKSQNGQTLRLKGQGAVNPKTKRRGDLMVKLIVKVPQTDDKRMLEAAREMDGHYKEDLRKDIRL
jgi:DnaJ-class molecular chaperone